MIKPIRRHLWMGRIQDAFTPEGDRATWRGVDEHNRFFGWMTRRGNYIRVYFTVDGRVTGAWIYPPPNNDQPNPIAGAAGQSFGRPPWR